jgi:citrate synthase
MVETLEDKIDFPYRPASRKCPRPSRRSATSTDIGARVSRLSHEDLARNCNYEETAYLLMNADLPTAAQLADFDGALKARRSLEPHILNLLRTLPPDGHPMQALAAAVAAMGMTHASVPFHDVAHPDHRQHRYDAAVGSSELTTLVAAWHWIRQGKEPVAPRTGLSHSANFLYMLTGTNPDPDLVKVFDVCMVLHAEHEMNASTFTTRVAASSLTDPYCAIAAAICSLRGPLHGGANERVLDMLGAIGGADKVEAWLTEALASKKTIWGIGHREYRVKDPRATILQEQNEVVFRKLGRTPLFDTAVKLEQVLEVHPKFGAAPTLREQKFPNVDYYSGIVITRWASPRSSPQFRHVARGRLAGALMADGKGNKIFRPKQIYEGERNRKVRPIAERA